MKNFLKKVYAIGAASAVLTACLPLSAAAGPIYTKDKTGTYEGYDFELWNEKDQGNVKMELSDSDGGFTCSWSGIQNCLFRTGKKLGSTQNWSDYAGINISYDVDYTPKGNSYMCVYGWTEEPTVEYYIVEAWGDWRPPGKSNSEAKAQITVNGNSYHVFTSLRENQPSIHGYETFEQYWSVRDSNPAKVYSKTHLTGDIDVAAHFAAWEKAGMKMGKMYEVALNIEGYMSSGEAVVYKNDLSFKGTNTTKPGETTTTTTTTMAEPDENGYFFHDSFEGGEGDWYGRGDAKIKTVDDPAFSGTAALSVTGRTDTWNGAAINLDASQFGPGNTYSFNVMAMQDAEATADLKLTMQYTLDGDDHYDEVAAVSASKGEWVQLANDAFTIPKGAENCILYVETPDNKIDFYIDEAFGAVKGTKAAYEGSEGMGINLGDINNDHVIDVLDLVAMRKLVLNASAGGNAPIKVQADLNFDKEVSSADMVLLSKYLHGTVKEFKK